MVIYILKVPPIFYLLIFDTVQYENKKITS